MARFVGLGVSRELTALCVVDETGRRLWRGQCATDPGRIERMVRKAISKRGNSYTRRLLIHGAMVPLT